MGTYQIIFNSKQMDVIEHIIFEYDTICHFGLDYPCLYYKEDTQEGLEYAGLSIYGDELDIQTERNMEYLIKFVQRDIRKLKKMIKNSSFDSLISEYKQDLKIHNQVLKILKNEKPTFQKRIDKEVA